MDLPYFRYHPDPLATGSVKQSGNRCVVCNEVRGYIYTASVYTRNSYRNCICPWCIADGSAHEVLGAKFTDPAFIGGGGLWESVPADIVEEVTFRTPGFATWQGQKWFTHCGDAAAFLGVVGYQELQSFGSSAIEAIQTNTGLDGDRWEEFFERLDNDGSPTAYLFQCLHCGQYGGYQDCA